MVARPLLLALGGFVALGADRSPAADLTKIDRTIRKEPAYRTEDPKYCLLVFGPKADYRVWLVLDGDTLYVDRNGNGDLTEKGEATGAESKDDPTRFPPLTLRRPDGRPDERLLVSLLGRSGLRSDTGRVPGYVYVSWDSRSYGAWGDETGPCLWARRPQDAPVLHVGGPLQMGFENRAREALERLADGTFELRAAVGTRGLGKAAFVWLAYDGTIPAHVHPTADLEFPARQRGAPPVRVRAVLKQRC